MVFLLCQQRQSTVYRKPFLGFYKKKQLLLVFRRSRNTEKTELMGKNYSNTLFLLFSNNFDPQFFFCFVFWRPSYLSFGASKRETCGVALYMTALICGPLLDTSDNIQVSSLFLISFLFWIFYDTLTGLTGKLLSVFFYHSVHVCLETLSGGFFLQKDARHKVLTFLI